MAYTDWRQRADEGWTAKGEQKYGAGREPGEPLPPKPDPDFDHAVKSSEKCWRESKHAGSPMWKLKMLVSLDAQYEIAGNGSTFHAEQRDWIRGKMIELLRLANPADVLGDPRVWTLVLCYFGEAGIKRLEDRVEAAKAVAA